MISNESTSILWAAPERGRTIAKIAIGGDFLPAGKLELPEVTGWREMSRGLASYFDDVATTFVNLEACLDAGRLHPRPLGGLGDIVSASTESLDYLAEIQSLAVGIANNHSFDFGDAGVERTRSALCRRAMIPIGAGRTSADPPEVFVWQGPGDVRVGFWAAATATLDPATRDKAGVEPATRARAREAREQMKALGAQFSIALLHAGCLRTNRPDPEQIRLMDSIANSGFDIVAASHSHRISGYQQICSDQSHPSFCFYGLGSIVSGYATSPLEREGLIVAVGLNGRSEMASLELRPVSLDTNGFGMIPSPDAAHEILDRFSRLSSEIADGSCERQFYREISQGLLNVYARDVKAAYRAGGVRALARKAIRVRPRHVRRLVHRVLG
jgi:hypothetical protein